MQAKCLFCLSRKHLIMNLNIEEAFNVAVDFLDKFYKQNKSDDFGSFLGDLLLFEDGSTADPAAWWDWLASVNKIKKQYKMGKEHEDVDFTLKQAYEVAEDFFNRFCEEISSDDFRILLKEMALLEDEKSTNPICWKEWVDSANKIKQLGDEAGIMF